MYCTECGKLNDENNYFCVECGKGLNSTNSEPKESLNSPKKFPVILSVQHYPLPLLTFEKIAFYVNGKKIEKVFKYGDKDVVHVDCGKNLFQVELNYGLKAAKLESISVMIEDGKDVEVQLAFSKFLAAPSLIFFSR